MWKRYMVPFPWIRPLSTLNIVFICFEPVAPNLLMQLTNMYACWYACMQGSVLNPAIVNDDSDQVSLYFISENSFLYRDYFDAVKWFVWNGTILWVAYICLFLRERISGKSYTIHLRN